MSILRDPRLWIASSVAFLAVTANGILSPIIPFLADPLGIAEGETGNILWMLTGFVMLSTPVVGWLSDRYGRKPILIPSIFFFGVGALIPLTESYAVILLLRAVQGIGVAGMTSLAVTILGDCYEGRELKSAVGHRAGAHSLGFAVSPAVAGGLALLGIFYPFFFFALAIPLGFFAMWKMEECHPGERHTLHGYGRDMWRILNRRHAWSVLFAVAHVFVLFYIMIFFVPFFLKDRFGLTALGIGLYQTVFFTSAAIVSLSAARIGERWSEQKLVVGGFTFSGGLIALVPFVNSPAGMVILVALWGAMHGLMFVPVYRLAIGLAPKAFRAGAVSVAQMFAYFGATLSPVALTVVWSYAGLNAVFFVSGFLGVMVFAASAIGWFSVEEKRAG